MVAEHNGNVPVVAVLGHYGNRNLGDEALVTTVIEGLRRSIPGVILLAVSMDPLDSARRHRIPAFPVRRDARGGPVDDVAGLGPPQSRVEPIPASDRRRRFRLGASIPATIKASLRGVRVGALELTFLVRAWRFARRSDLLMVAGSDQLVDDFGGASGYPWTMLKWSLIARLAGARLAFVSVGAGPLDRRISRVLVRAALRLAHYVSWRDQASRALVEGGHPIRDGYVCPDLGFSLRSTNARPVDAVRSIGINPMPIHDGRYWPDPKADRYAAYVAVMAETIVRLRVLGLEPFLFAIQPADRQVIEDISAALEQTCSGDRVSVHLPEDLEQLRDVLQLADLLVATRYQGVVLGVACSRPVVAICHHRKIRDVAESVGLGQYAVSLDALEVDTLVDSVTALAERVPSIQESIDQAVSVKRLELDDQFARIAKLVDRQRPPAKQHAMEPS